MRFKALLAAGVVLFLFAGCAKDRLSKYHNAAERQRFAKVHDLSHLPSSDVPLVLNDRVYAWMDYFQGAGRGHFQRYLERSGRYMKMMQGILKQNGLPQDLIYVALIESGFNNNAYSRAAAVGPWQFIRGTGSRYGLDINGWVDDRRHPVKATWAAARYLRDLYDEFGDWYLAMAAYNAGEGRIRDAVANSGTKDFWEIIDSHERLLRAETRDYVPKFIAAAIMAKMPQNFGFTNVNYQEPLEYDITTVETQTDLDVIADCAGVGTDAIADLNPHLVRGSTPPNMRNYEINLPKGAVSSFKEKYSKIPEDERVKIAYHRVRRGESVASIARRYGVSKSSLLAANDLSAKHRLHAGTTLVIPRGGAAAYAYNSGGDDGGGTVRTKKLVKYRVKKGDSVSRIASKFGVTSSQVKSWNSITSRNPLRAGRVLKIYKPVYVSKAGTKKEKVQVAMLGDSDGAQHQIKAGDTLWAISQRYGMSVDELAAMNGMDAGSKIKAGQKIMVRQKKGKTVIEASGDDVEQDNAVQTKNDSSTDEKKNMTIAKAAASEASPDDIDLSAEDGVRAEKAAAPAKSRETKKSVTVSKSYKVKKGDSLIEVAKKHGVSVTDLMKWNKITNPKKVRAGQTLKIQTTEVRSQKSDARVREANRQETVKQEPKQVAVASQQEEETAEKMDTPAETVPAVKKEEGSPLKLSDIPMPAQESSLNYKVKSGDTLWDIARRHKVTIAEIQKWNNLTDPSAVKPGTNLTIHR